MSASSPPAKPDRIYYSPSMGLAGTNPGEERIAYVPADIADEMIEALRAVDAAWRQASDDYAMQNAMGKVMAVLRKAGAES